MLQWSYVFFTVFFVALFLSFYFSVPNNTTTKQFEKRKTIAFERWNSVCFRLNISLSKCLCLLEQPISPFGFLEMQPFCAASQSQHVVPNDEFMNTILFIFYLQFFFPHIFSISLCVCVFFFTFFFCSFFWLLLLFNTKCISRAVSRSHFILSDWMSLKCIKSSHRVCLTALDHLNMDSMQFSLAPL